MEPGPKHLRAAKESFYSEGYYRGIYPASVNRIKKVLELAAALRPSRLLDVGCGDGTITAMLKEVTKAREVFGVEISSEGAALAQAKGIRVTVTDVEQQRWPFDSDYFGLVYCGELIEHVFEPAHVLSETYRVLEAGGICLLTTPNLASWYNRLFLMMGYQPFEYCASLRHAQAGKAPIGGLVRNWGGEHLRVMTLKALKALARASGFKVEKVVGVHGGMPERRPLWIVATALDRLMSRQASLATTLVCKLRK